jgi:hypothetical protein
MELLRKPYLFKKIILLILIYPISIIALAQDIHFSQFFEAPLLRNPSLAGIFTGDVLLLLIKLLRLMVNTNCQWAREMTF